ncbi:uncharacterized protein ATNIH1004_001712 [Aspergillus tanneri]|uniref:Myb-like domain-containing protein n=1 Tax=Aspergillus tanneri TaxID=1220188 RepID=A0A5M9NDJ1_9EURO|nr:uncharacterized protein ATNIH1004_001712 [Aspergillus tanneri]KAA8652807.1 hypothetical protein ATNIH1004_001712 [Aspergillus tanneri]
MTPNLAPSNPSGTVLKSPKFYSYNSERHPLPARPPVEVCMDNGVHSDAQTTRDELEDLERATSADPHPQTFSSEDTLLRQVLPGTENIDPAIINNNIFPRTEHIQASQDPAVTDGHLSQSPCFPSTDPPLQSSRHGAEDMIMPDLQYPRVAKRLNARKRYIGNGTSSAPKSGAKRRKNLAFPAFRSQFLAMSVEDRLQFLSWLFEGALSHCISTSLDMNTASTFSSSPDLDTPIAYDLGCDYQTLITQPVHTHNAHPTRKGRPWSVEEDRLLVKLREEQNLAWSEVARRFAQTFPGRNTMHFSLPLLFTVVFMDYERAVENIVKLH